MMLAINLNMKFHNLKAFYSLFFIFIIFLFKCAKTEMFSCVQNNTSFLPTSEEFLAPELRSANQ